MPSQSVCPSGWKEFRGNCYGFVPGFQSWQEANKFCADRKVFLYYVALTIVGLLNIQNAFQAKLVPFISGEEQKFIENNVLNNPLTLTWNHIMRTSLDKRKLMYSDKKFFWLDKTSWDYTNFADWGINF